MITASTKVITETTSATCLAAVARTTITTTAPTAGSRARTVSQGKVMIAPSPQPSRPRTMTDADDCGPGHHGQCVRADEAVLRAAESGRDRR